ADICVDRCGHLRRPMRTSASTDADICVDRCGHPRRPIRTSASVGADHFNTRQESSYLALTETT
ncbi:hypothetical protein, partial [Leyella stercorea]|uniref:hypothetical protein n=1 Tax=Leyella stercorea TaxID=363265 RepID=UPI00242F20E5